MGVPLRSNFTRTTTTDDDGKFTDTYSVASTDPTGKWTVAAEIRGNTSEPADFNIFTDTPIKIGVIRNLLMYGQCMEEASIMAAEDINDAGGIKVDGDQGRKIILRFGDEGTEATTGVAEITRLITVEGVDFITGGYRSDVVFPMREVAMDYQKIFIMDAATTELLNCAGSYVMPNCGYCLRCDYERYKYIFRILPPNSSQIFMGTLIPFLNGYVVPKLGGSEESPVKVVAVIENLAWTDILAKIFDGAFGLAFGNTLVKARDTAYRPGHLDTDFETILNGIKDSGAQIIIHVLSDEAGLSFIKQWGEMQIPAIPVGVNVLSQGSEMWDDTDGKCEYETIVSNSLRVPISQKTIPFWDKYVERWACHPLFTAFGSYMAINTLAEAIERAGTIGSDAVVAELEKTDRISIMGRFKYTRYHDIYVPAAYTIDAEGNYHWIPTEYTQPMMVQWREPGEPVAVYPFDKPYSQDLEFPPWMQTP